MYQKITKQEFDSDDYILKSEDVDYFCFCIPISSVDPFLENLPNNLPINTNFMSNLLNKFKLALKTEPDKSLIKHGITDSEGTLTSEGETLYKNWQFQRDKQAFADEVLPLLEEKKD